MKRLDRLKDAIDVITRNCNAAHPEGDADAERQELLGAIRDVRDSLADLSSLINAFNGENAVRTPLDQVTVPECRTTHEFRVALQSCGADNDRLAGELRAARTALSAHLRGVAA